MNRRLHQIICELSDISGVEFALYACRDECVACTAGMEVPRETLDKLFADTAEEPEADGYSAFPVRTGRERMLLIARGAAGPVPGRMAASELRLFFETVQKSSDKNVFAASLVSGEIPPGEIYKRAARLKLADAPRVLFLFEFAQPLPDANAMRMLSSIFAGGRQDFIYMRDETHVVLIKAYENGDDAEARADALSAVDTVLSELMVKTRVGYSLMKQTLAELPDAGREAALALRVSSVFQKQQEVAAYSKLGIARLIHELPRDLCELFLDEVFGGRTFDMDDEMQVTIRLFFEHNLNISETARQLYLHRNTLVYRLERFEKMTGLDVRRFDDAMTFRIAMMVRAHCRDLDQNGREDL